MEFAKAEGAAFVNGTGVNQPKGFLQSPVTDEVDDVRAFGALQYVASGAADGFAAANPEDRLIDLVQSLRAPYRQGAAFVMNSATLARIRKSSEVRRVGKECVRTCRSRWSPYLSKKNKYYNTITSI